MNAADGMPVQTVKATFDYLENLPKSTVIQITSASGSRFWLEAEGGAWHDFIHHKGDVPRRFGGSVSQMGRRRLFWTRKVLARWVADGLCAIELASPTTGADQ
ncbi:hypothetical protein [Microbacterium sp. A84]|uniref:hypothetical protein n=1 Tax=Microbacterium sp. A84 TaxID=3450715 RepID=UPI003F43887E